MVTQRKREIGRKGGYSKTGVVFNKIFNFFFSLILILLSSPLFLVIPLIIKLTSRGPVFYKGVRLGINKKPFVMYKFRTLVEGAEKLIGAELLSAKQRHELATPVGTFLRNTRLDELPQLFNILKGDMVFLGPRPIRPAIYEKFCKNIKGYDKRFTIKPGLVGYSQLFTAYSAPKRIRTLIDNKFLRKRQKFWWDTVMTLYAGFIIVKTAFKESTKSMWNNIIKRKILNLYKEKRNLARVKLDRAKVYIRKDSGEWNYIGRLIDINEEAFLIHANSNISEDKNQFRLEMNIRAGRKGYKKKSAVCNGTVYRKSMLENEPFKFAYVIKYNCNSPLNSYIIHQYFLFESMGLI